MPPEVNGVLDDEVWKLAKPAGEFLQKSPQQNVPHSQRTEFRVLYDDNAIKKLQLREVFGLAFVIDILEIPKII